MTKPVIDLFKVIKIDEQNRIVQVFATRTDIIEPGNDPIAVQKTRHGVMDYQLTKFFCTLSNARFKGRVPILCNAVFVP